LRALSTAGRFGVAWLFALAALFAGTGILYLVAHEPVLRIGPHVRGALPLEQLAGNDAQPLGRLVVAWVPAGFAAALAVGLLTSIGGLVRVISLAATAAVVLWVAGGFSDAIAVNDPVGPHIGSQFTRPGTLVAVGLFALGAACARLVLPRLASRT
jgi:hypothetical protein